MLTLCVLLCNRALELVLLAKLSLLIEKQLILPVLFHPSPLFTSGWNITKQITEIVMFPNR